MPQDKSCFGATKDWDVNPELHASLLMEREEACAISAPLTTIAHKRITELIPKQFRFGNSSTKITEHNSHSNSVKDSALLTETH